MTIDMENKEWPEDGKLPELVGKDNPFVVPGGYFDALDERIAAAVRMDGLKSRVAETGFAVPDGYFEELAGNIQARIAVEEFTGRETGLTVPDGYFDELSGNIQSRIAVETAMEAGEAFEVPAGYFENLSSQIQSRIFVEEALSEQEAFTVPDGYFEQLNNKILNRTVTQQAVERRGGVIRLMRSTAFKYATAACFVLVAGASMLFWPSATSVQSGDPSEYLQKELASLPVDELQGYVQMSMEGVDVQHTVDFENLPVTDADFDAALEEYAQMQ